MPDVVTDWPRKTRELQNHHMDSTLWNDFAFRDDDVIVATYAKSGTTWTQQIVTQLIHNGSEVSVGETSPWWDMRILPPEAREQTLAQTDRRVLKTHLPLDALVMSPKAKYLYVARDGRDIVWSLHNHHANHSELAFELLNDTPGRVGPPMPRADPDIRSYFNHWLANDGAPYWSFWENISSWWAARHLPNVRLVHFARLKADLEGEMRDIAEFLGVEVAEDRWPACVEHCTFDYMKAHADNVVPAGGIFWEGGATTFINRGTNDRWRDVLSPEESLAYERVAAARLGEDCARWLMTGEGA